MDAVSDVVLEGSTFKVNEITESQPLADEMVLEYVPELVRVWLPKVKLWP